MPRALFVPVPLRGGVAERPNVAVRNVAARRLVDALLIEECSIQFKVLPDPYLYADYYAHTARPVALADIRDWAISRPRYGLPDACRDLRRMVRRKRGRRLRRVHVHMCACTGGSTHTADRERERAREERERERERWRRRVR